MTSRGRSTSEVAPRCESWRRTRRPEFSWSVCRLQAWEDGVLLSQVRREDGGVQVVAREGTEAYELATEASLYDLAIGCAASAQGLKARILDLGLRRAVDVRAFCDQGRMLPPILHADPAHLHITGTTSQHRQWFHPGTGDVLIGPGAPVIRAGVADEFADEAGIAGVYVIGPDGAPSRVGFVLANGFSDIPGQRLDDLYPGHFKLWQASFGPELLVGPLPGGIGGTSRIRRGDEIVVEMPLQSGGENMSQSVAALEHDLFRSGIHLRPGDVHIHIFGTARLSFAHGFAPGEEDVLETEAAPFGLPLWNPLTAAAGVLPPPQSIHVL